MKISVAICTYNGEKFIKEQLESIVNQTVKPDEIILCDDNSTDETIKIARNYLNDCGIFYSIEINPINIGVVKNFEKAIGLTTGDIIFLSDQDDVWEPNKVQIIINEFIKDSSCLMVFSDAYIVDSWRGRTGTKLWETLNFSYHEFKSREFIDILLNRCVVTGATMAIKRELYNYSLPFNDAWVHDGWLAINASILGKVVAINKPLIEYRQHCNNMIGAKKINLPQKVILYLKNIKHLDEIREDKYKRYMFVLEKISNDENEVSYKVINCFNFWDQMLCLSNCKLISGWKLIIKNITNKNYSKFYTGIRGAVRDFIYIFLRNFVKL